MAILCDCGAILGVSEDDKALDQLVGVVVSIIRFMWVTTRGWLSLNETMLSYATFMCVTVFAIVENEIKRGRLAKIDG